MSTIMSIFFLVLLSLLTLMVFVMTIIDRGSATNADDDRQIIWPMASLNTLYLNMAPQRRTAANIYLLSYMLRRGHFALCIVLMQDYPALQLISLISVSTLSLCILTSGRPYLDRLSTFTIIAYEVIFGYLCAFCLIFSPEYIHRSVSIAADAGNAVCITVATVVLAGIILLSYSIIWQILYNRRRRDAIVNQRESLKARQYMLRQESTRKLIKMATVVEEEQEQSVDDN